MKQKKLDAEQSNTPSIKIADGGSFFPKQTLPIRVVFSLHPSGNLSEKSNFLTKATSCWR